MIIKQNFLRHEKSKHQSFVYFFFNFIEIKFYAMIMLMKWKMT